MPGCSRVSTHCPDQHVCISAELFLEIFAIVKCSAVAWGDSHRKGLVDAVFSKAAGARLTCRNLINNYDFRIGVGGSRVEIFLTVHNFFPGYYDRLFMMRPRSHRLRRHRGSRNRDQWLWFGVPKRLESRPGPRHREEGSAGLWRWVDTFDIAE